MASANASILVVEDDEALRVLIEMVLTDSGYHVRTATTGPAALKLLEQEPRKIDLLLVDIVLPDNMSGPQLAKRLQAAQPDLKVLFTTGYNTEHLAAAKDLILEEGVNLIQKPYDHTCLLEIVRAVLASR